MAGPMGLVSSKIPGIFDLGESAPCNLTPMKVQDQKS